MKKLTGLATLGLLASLLAMAPLSAQVEASITVTPAMDLVDGETVNVRGSISSGQLSGFAGQCAADGNFNDLISAGSSCRIMTFAGSTPDFDFDDKVFAEFSSELGGNIDCRAVGCVVAVANSDFTEVLTAPITFLPPVVVDPNSGDEGDPVTISLQGLTVTSASAIQCNGPDACGVIGPATVANDTVTANVTADLDFVLDDGTPASCEPSNCRLGLRLVDPGLRGGQVDATAPFVFGEPFGITVTPSVVNRGMSVEITGAVPDPRGSVQFAQCRADTNFSSLFTAGYGCEPPRSNPTGNPIAITYTPEGFVNPYLGGSQGNCGIAGRCVIALEGSTSGFDVYTAPIQVLPRPTLDVVPSTELFDGQTVQVTTNALASLPGATAFSMQCGFQAFYAMYCGPTGPVIDDFPTGVYDEPFDLRQSFTADGVQIDCDINASCVVFVLVLDAAEETYNGAVQPISFAPRP